MFCIKSKTFFFVLCCSTYILSMTYVNIVEMEGFYREDAIDLKVFNDKLIEFVNFEQQESLTIIVPEESDSNLILDKKYTEIIDAYKADGVLYSQYRSLNTTLSLSLKWINKNGKVVYYKNIDDINFNVEPGFYKQLAELILKKEKLASPYFDHKKYRPNELTTQCIVQLGFAYPHGNDFTSKKYNQHERFVAKDSSWYYDTTFSENSIVSTSFKIIIAFIIEEQNRLQVSWNTLGEAANFILIGYDYKPISNGVVSLYGGVDIGIGFVKDDEIELANGILNAVDLKEKEINNGAVIVPKMGIELLNREKISVICEGSFITVLGRKERNQGYTINIGLGYKLK